VGCGVVRRELEGGLVLVYDHGIIRIVSCSETFHIHRHMSRNRDGNRVGEGPIVRM
jgi:hypothetical protein